MNREHCRACGRIVTEYILADTEYGHLPMCNDECSTYWKGDLKGLIGTEKIEGHEVTLYFNEDKFREPATVAKYRKESYMRGSSYVEFATLRTTHLHIACIYSYCGYKEVTSTHFNFRILVLTEKGSWRVASYIPPTLHLSAESPTTKEEALDKLRKVFIRYLQYPNELEYTAKVYGQPNQLKQISLF